MSSAGSSSSATLAAVASRSATGLLALLRPHLASIRERWERRHRPPLLTAREIHVLELVAEGLTHAEVAARLMISHTTVRAQLENVFDKLGVHTRTAAVAWLNDVRRTS